MASWKCGASSSLDIGPDRTWDGAAAERRIFEWAGWDGSDAPSGGGKAKQGFGAYDSSDAELKGSYKLPFADVVDDKLVAIPAGVRAAKSRASQEGTDLPQSVKDDFIAICDGYLGQMNDGKEKQAASGRMMDELTLYTTVRIMPMGERDLSPKARDGLVSKAKEMALDPDVIDEHPPYFFRAAGSNSNVDAFSTQMQPSTLRNYASDWAEGRALLIAHQKNVLPLGHTLDGQYRDRRSGDGYSAVATCYILPDLTLGGQDTNSAITAIRGGTSRDVSVGFHGGRMVCSICSRDMLDILELIFGEYDRDEVCPHIPGVTYTMVDAKGKPTGERKLCVGLVEDAHSAELSMAYEGATPGAAVLKGTRMAEAGLLPPNVVTQLESRYRMRLPGPRPNWPGTEAPATARQTTQGGDSMSHAAAGGDSGQQRQDPPAQGATTTTQPAEAAPAAQVTPERQLAGMRDAMLAAGFIDANWQGDPAERILWAGTEMARLRPLADDGLAYKAALVEETLVEGVRANGNEWPREQHKAILEGLGVSQIRMFRDQYKAMADKMLQGGRQSSEGTPAGGNGDGAAAAAAAGTNGAQEWRPPRSAFRG